MKCCVLSKNVRSFLTVIHYIDKAVICLKVLCWQLSDLLNEVVVNGGLDQEDQNDLSQLHWCLCQLCIEYDTKLVFVQTIDPSHCLTSIMFGQRGRPRKIINYAMVRIYMYS